MTSSLTSFKSELPRDTFSAWPQFQHSSCRFAVQRSPSPSSPADIPCIFMFDQFLCLFLGPYSKRTGVSLCSLLYLQTLVQCLACSICSVNICGLKEKIYSIKQTCLLGLHEFRNSLILLKKYLRVGCLGGSGS